MSIYHFHAKTIARSKGKCATAAAAYRSGEKINDERQGMTFDYTKKRGIVHSEILLPAGAPQELRERSTLWNTIEAVEKRKDAQIAREIEISLPAALTREQQIEAAREFCAVLVRDGMCADMCIHDKGDGNPHAHIMLSMRNITPDGFGKKRRDWNDQKKLMYWRETWANKANEALEKAGINERIDHRSYEAQGIDKEPMIHTSNRADKIAKNNEIRARNEEREALRNEYKQIEKRLAEIEREEKRPRTPSELRKAQIEAINAEIEEQLKELKARDIKELSDMLRDYRAQRSEWVKAHTTDKIQLDTEAKQIELVSVKKKIKRLIAEECKVDPYSKEYDPPTREEGGFFGFFTKTVIDEAAARDRHKEILNEISEAHKEEDEIYKRHTANLAKILDEGEREYDRQHPKDVRKYERICAAIDITLEKQREREEIEAREAKIEKIDADLALIDRRSADAKEHIAELAAAERLRAAGSAAAKADPQDIEVLEKLQPKAAQIVEMAREHAVQQAQKKRSRGRDFER